MHKPINKLALIFFPQLNILISTRPIFNSIYKPPSILFPISIILNSFTLRLAIDPIPIIFIFIMLHFSLPIYL